ncbi:hypothetical protein [Variovorax paradoxus]|jgi:hypothetical protein|uniref:hypothetical protein n=1 Tax=Variovorax paradoxus TaxID=34073 RepID=UPI002480B178|nr:hypothetical protein [Variovorax paradoxus]WGT65246.1 hypothetical protein QHG62_07850 [Variovorax paradoxus]
MNTSKRLAPVLRTGLIAGTFASLASTAALMLRGRREAGSAVAPTNATSHWLWGDQALQVYRPTLRHTGLGYATHHASAIFWALLYAWLHAERRPPQSVPAALASAGAATAVACTIDYTITPRRLTPGFEHHLSKGSMAAVYGLFAVGLAAGCLLAQRGRE